MLEKTLSYGFKYRHAWSVVIFLLSFQISDAFSRHFALNRKIIKMSLVIAIFFVLEFISCAKSFLTTSFSFIESPTFHGVFIFKLLNF